MALTLLVPGVLREVWQESATLNGGNSRTIPTNIRVSDVILPRILATLYVTPVAGSPQISATVVNMNGLAIVSVQNNAAPGNTATYRLDITRLQSPQQALGGTAGYVHVVMSGSSGLASGGFVLPTTVVDVANYPVATSDVVLQVKRTSSGICTIGLPAIATVPPGRIVIVKDTGYNSSVNNITVARSGGDKINGVAGDYTINVDGSALWFQANSDTNDWEIL